MDVELIFYEKISYFSCGGIFGGLPSCMLTEIARQAGVHIYSGRGDQVFSAPGWFGIHAKCPGDLEIPFPEAYRFRDVITGETFPAGEKLVLRNLRRGETRIIELETE